MNYKKMCVKSKCAPINLPGIMWLSSQTPVLIFACTVQSQPCCIYTHHNRQRLNQAKAITRELDIFLAAIYRTSQHLKYEVSFLELFHLKEP